MLCKRWCLMVAQSEVHRLEKQRLRFSSHSSFCCEHCLKAFKKRIQFVYVLWLEIAADVTPLAHQAPEMLLLMPYDEKLVFPVKNIEKLGCTGYIFHLQTQFQPLIQARVT